MRLAIIDKNEKIIHVWDEHPTSVRTAIAERAAEFYAPQGWKAGRRKKVAEAVDKAIAEFQSETRRM